MRNINTVGGHLAQAVKRTGEEAPVRREFGRLPEVSRSGLHPVVIMKSRGEYKRVRMLADSHGALRCPLRCWAVPWGPRGLVDRAVYHNLSV